MVKNRSEAESDRRPPKRNEFEASRAIQNLVIDCVRRVIGWRRYPGQYLAADQIGSFLAKLRGPAIGRIADYEVELDLRDELQRQIFFGIYDRPLTNLLKSTLSPGDVFFDIGANVGYFTLLASNLVGDNGHVHAFEPIPQNAEAIRRNVDRNALTNIKIIEAAVSDSGGTLPLFVSDSPKSSGWASIVPSNSRRRQIQVPKLTLDEYVQRNEKFWPDLIKMDIEGAESFALAGMQHILNSELAPDLVVEVNPYLLDREGLTQDAITTPLLASGYELKTLTAGGLKPFHESDRATTLIDLFASKKSQPLELPNTPRR
jgi:FkbM family methyltransferase